MPRSGLELASAPQWLTRTRCYYGPPDCEWGYYSYYPYACAPYGYYGPSWFLGGAFIGVGPWYGWGWGRLGRLRLRGGYGYRGGYG